MKTKEQIEERIRELKEYSYNCEGFKQKLKELNWVLENEEN